ncbi:cyclase family protein [Actinomycetota bacterium]
MLVDLSHPLSAGMPIYPGDPTVDVERALTIDTDVVEVHRLHLGTHSGTHLDAPSHTVPDGRTIEQVTLEETIGPALVLGVREAARDGLITWESIQPDTPDTVPSRVFISTGWDAHWGTPKMTEHPGLSPRLVQELWERGMRLLGVDCLSPDPTGGETLPVHDVVLGQDGLIVENLRGLTPLIGSVVDVSVVPMAWTGLDGSPIRAWAQVA